MDKLEQKTEAFLTEIITKNWDSIQKTYQKIIQENPLEDQKTTLENTKYFIKEGLNLAQKVLINPHIEPRFLTGPHYDFAVDQNWITKKDEVYKRTNVTLRQGYPLLEQWYFVKGEELPVVVELYTQK